MVSNRNAQKTGKSGRFRILYAVLIFVVISVGGNFLADFLNPQRKALVPACIDTKQPDAWFTNSCDFDIRLSFCLETGTDEDYSDCPVIPLAPGEGASPPKGRKTEADVYGNRHIWACKAPFRPAMKPSLSNRNIMQAACARPPLKKAG